MTMVELKKIIMSSLRELKFKTIKITKGYKHWTGFAEKDNKIIYFSTPNIDDFEFKTNPECLIRIAKDYNDFTGDSNNFCEFTVEDITKLISKLIKGYTNETSN